MIDDPFAMSLEEPCVGLVLQWGMDTDYLWLEPKSRHHSLCFDSIEHLLKSAGKSGLRRLPGPNRSPPVFVQLRIPAGIDHEVFTAGRSSCVDQRQFLGGRRIAFLTIHVIVENYWKITGVGAGTKACGSSIPSQCINRVFKASTNAAYRNRNCRIRLPGFEVLPGVAMNLIRSAEICVNGFILGIGELPVPRAIVFDLPEPGDAELGVFDHADGQIALRRPGAYAVERSGRNREVPVVDKARARRL